MSPTGPDLAGREHPIEQLLRLLGQAGDLIEHKRAAVRLDDLARLCGEGTRERALFVAEQLAVDDVRSDRFAVERQQRPLGAQACAVDGVGNGFLARARFADDQDRKAGARGLRGNGEGSAKFGRRADQLLERQFRRELLRYGRQLARGTAAIGIGGKRVQQSLRRDRPHQEIRRPCAHRLDRDGDGVAVREDDHRKVRAILAKRGDQLRSALRVPATEQHREHFAAVRTLEQCSGSLFVRRADDAPSGASGDRGNQPALLRIGVEQQQ